MAISDPTQNIMRLLSQVIIADGHILETEIEAFVKSVQDLRLLDTSGHPIKKPEILKWFENYLGELNESWSEEPKDVVLTRLILSLAEWPDKQSVVQSLENISKADAEFHIEEKLLISIVRAYWQYEGLEASGATIGG